MKTPSKRKNNSINHFISWFEIPAINLERAVDFYNEIFQIQMDTHVVGDYSMAYFPASEGAISGAIICGEGSEPCDKGALIYLNGGDNLEGVLSKVEKAGGRVLMEKQTIGDNAGCFALFIDTEGNKLALHSRS